jgi:nucleoside-diphosphate-sugar epimerase
VIDVAREFANRRVLVVGGAGFVGSNLVKMLLGESDSVRVTVIDNLMSSERTNLPDDGRLEFIEGSITNDPILAGIEDVFNYIFHLACYHGNQSSIHDPLADHENNTLTTLKLMNRIKDFRNLEKLVYSSAGCSVAEKTFGDAHATTEDDPISLVQDSPYSISKVIGEFYSVYFHRRHGLPTVRARFQNVYGPGEVLGAGQWRGTPATVWRNVTPVFIYKALNGIALPLENEGVATRDFIFVEDICRGLIACAVRGESGDVYNIASGRETSIRELASMINELAGNEAGFELLPGRPWDSSGKRFGSTAKSRSVLGFEATVSLEEGLSNTIDWTRGNLSLINACIHKHDEHMKTAG